MPLTSKSNGPELRPGDYVKMEWVIARVFPDVDIAMVRRGGAASPSTAASPQVVTVRLGTGKTSLKLLPTHAPLAPGTRCLLIWRVAQVYAETGTVLVRRDGLGGSPEYPVPITATAGATAAELEYIPPGEITPLTPVLSSEIVMGRAVRPELADALPFVFELGDYVWPPDPVPVAPVLTGLVPQAATIGSPSFTLRVQGTGFAPGDTIVFNGFDEPTTVVSAGEVTTGVNMAVWTAPSLPLPVTVRSLEGAVSNALSFTFLPAAARR